jgi:DnaJ-class molecular chaperone
MAQKDYYFVLGVEHDESARGIRAAFRQLARRYHPDRAGPRATRQFQSLAEAYHVLSDAERRAAYDRGLAHAAKLGGAARSRPIATPWGRATGGLAVRGDGVRELGVRRPRGAELFTRFADARARRGSPQPLRVEAMLSRRDAVSGGVLSFTVPLFYPCGACRGSGWRGELPCRACGGDGLVEEPGVARTVVPPLVRDGTVIEVPVTGLGINDMFLEVCVRVA